jgi:OOP family OmpA-OmpF porin
MNRQGGSAIYSLVTALLLSLAMIMGPAQPSSAASPYQLSLVREGDTIAIGGQMPSEAARDALFAAIKAASPDVSLFDMIEIAANAPAGFEALAAFAGPLATRVKPGAVLISGTDLTIEGKADALLAFDAITQALERLPPGARLLRVAVAPPVVKPFTLVIARRGQAVTLEGFVASETEKAALGAAARLALPGLTVTERLRIVEGSPSGMDWVGAGRFALTLLARLSEGSVRLEDRALSIEGQALDRAGYAAANLAVRATPLPAGAELKAAAIRAPVISPYRWLAEKGDGGILLQGYVPSEAIRAANRAAAEALFAPLSVRDSQELAEGAPQGFAEAAVAALGQLALVDKGRAVIQDRALNVVGEAASETAAAGARAAIEGSVPFGFSVSHVIGVPQPPAASSPARVAAVRPAAIPAVPDTCSPRIGEEMAAGGIAFQFGRDTMRPESVTRLRRIAAILKECPQLRFTVAGHTDSDGVAEQNVDLSHRRAQAVVSALIRQGVEASRLLAEGHGSTRPIAANDSPANKARNRRIEFTVAR